MTSDATPSDGRVARGTRSRAAIVEALLELVGEGALRPTAQEVAARAGVGIRTVFRHFSDMESLYAELSAALRAEIRPHLDAFRTTEGDLDIRVRELVLRRTELFEVIAPYMRSTDVLRWQSRFLADEHRKTVREQRTHLLAVLPELEAEDDDLVQALELVTSFAAWNRLRIDQQLGVARARAAVERAALALLAPLAS